MIKSVCLERAQKQLKGNLYYYFQYQIINRESIFIAVHILISRNGKLNITASFINRFYIL